MTWSYGYDLQQILFWSQWNRSECSAFSDRILMILALNIHVFGLLRVTAEPFSHQHSHGYDQFKFSFSREAQDQIIQFCLINRC